MSAQQSPVLQTETETWVAAPDGIGFVRTAAVQPSPIDMPKAWKLTPRIDADREEERAIKEAAWRRAQLSKARHGELELVDAIFLRCERKPSQASSVHEEIMEMPTVWSSSRLPELVLQHMHHAYLTVDWRIGDYLLCRMWRLCMRHCCDCMKFL